MMDLEEVKHRFPETAHGIEALERSGFNSRNDDWINTLNPELAKTACWVMGKVGDPYDADVLVQILSSDRNDLWREAATALSLVATDQHLAPLQLILTTASNPTQREGAAYAIAFLSRCQVTEEMIQTLINIAANEAEIPAVRAQALEGLGNKLSQDFAPALYQDGVAALMQALDSPNAEVRFWACFAAGATLAQQAVP
ncbi:MAG: hypothetical protein KME13_25625 [Myxacorys californica WJT36-NPBG1]|jgi:HEAT repeat protein|nr:hypothetical protein [Myxacorys californica WJT36-NPBG1]